MTTDWITLAPGIRCREHPQRKHGVRPDRYFTLRLSIDGRRVEEALGWASDGWTLKRAQEELGKLRIAKRTGDGPATLREQAEAKPRAARQKAEEEAARTRRQKTVADLWDRYSKEVVSVANKPRTAGEKTRMWERRIKPALGALKIEELTEEDAGAVVRAPLRLDASGRVIGGKAAAGNLYRLLHHMFRKALGWGLRPKELGNPLDPISEPKVPRRERLLTAREVGALMKALDAAEAERTEEPQVIAVIRAAILTGARIGDVNLPGGKRVVGVILDLDVMHFASLPRHAGNSWQAVVCQLAMIQTGGQILTVNVHFEAAIGCHPKRVNIGVL